MSDSFLQIGAGGILAIMVIREVFGFMSKRKTNGSSGERDPEYWKSEFRKAVREEVEPLAERSREELREIKTLIQRLLER